MPSPTPIPTPFACPPSPTTGDATLELRIPAGPITIPLEPGVSVPLPSASIAPVDPGAIVVEGTVLGGRELRADLAIDDLQGDPAIVITAITARFIPLDASRMDPVEVALDGASVVLTLPDRDAVGRLLVAIDWSTSCGSGSGGGAVAMNVVESATAVGCPTTTEAFDDAFGELAKIRISIGGIEQPLDIFGWSTRWTSGDGVVDFATLFPNWDRNAVITVAPGANVPVRESVDDLRVVYVTAPIYRRADVDAYFDTDVAPESVAIVKRPVNAKGYVNIPAPLEPGDYVFDIHAEWLTACFELSTTRSVSVKVG